MYEYELFNAYEVREAGLELEEPRATLAGPVARAAPAVFRVPEARVHAHGNVEHLWGHAVPTRPWVEFQRLRRRLSRQQWTLSCRGQP